MFALVQIQEFYRYKRETDNRFSVRTVADLYNDNDDDDDDGLDDDDLSQSRNIDEEPMQRRRPSRYEMIRMMERRRVKIGKALNRKRYFEEQLNLAVEHIATDRANLMLERHLIAVTKERMRMQADKGSSSSCLTGLIRSKFKGIPPESFSVECLLDIDKHDNSKSSSASDVDPSKNFQASIMVEDRVRKYFPKLRERCRNLANIDEATKLQQDIKLQEDILNYLYLKVEAISFRKEFKKKSTNNKPISTALVPLSSSTLSTPKWEADRRRKRKQLLLPPPPPSRLRTGSSEDTRSSGVGSLDNLFRDVIGQLGTSSESRSTSRTASSTTPIGTFRQVTIEIVDS